MPVRYGSDLDEHHAVRSHAGVFDISHMAEIFVTGDPKFLDYAVGAKPSDLKVGRAKYTLLLNEDGKVIDDLIVYRLAENEFLVVANAGNRQAAFAALKSRASGFEVEVADRSDDYSLIAIQGPKAAGLLQTKSDVDLTTLPYYSIAAAKLNGTAVHLARTGYTGEDGFEVLVRNQDAESVWDLLLSMDGVKPCGLAARDTLRLEAGMPLYGHELDLNTNPFEAGLQKTLRFEKEFVGSAVLDREIDKTPHKKLFALRGEGKRAARQDYEIFIPGGKLVGKITSGILSPTLGYPIALAYLEGDAGIEIGDKLEADVRGTRVLYEVVAMPFYKREGK